MIASIDLLEKVDRLSSEDLAWLSGYCWARTKQEHSLTTLASDVEVNTVGNTESRQILILSASQTGNAKRLAEQLQQQLQGLSANIQHQSIGDYKSKNLAQEDIVILISSTQGEGEYPEEAISFAKFLFGKRAPDLSHLCFAVLALGDSSYPLFCEAGKNLDERFAALGAKRLYERIDCDLDYQTQAEQWQNDVTTLLQTLLVNATKSTEATVNLTSESSQSTTTLYSKETPYTASLITRQKITSRQASKNTIHLEIDLGDSALNYQPGDALGVYAKNAPALVDAFLSTLSLDEHVTVQLKSGETCTLKQALSEYAELTQNNAMLVKRWAELSAQKELITHLETSEVLQNYADCTPLLAMIKQYPARLEAQAFFDFLRPLVPRMYSIASAQDEVGSEVHLTLGLVEYQYQDQNYSGVASHYLGHQLEEDDEIQIFIEANPRFRLPDNDATPIIMIGAGTGIAPFRAFMQQRENNDATGKAWLIYGNQKFTDDFLYQSEWQRWHKLGLLHNTSLAWSRQNHQKKIYVQDKIIEDGEQIWQWLQEGAHIYVCGDANKMAKAVEDALLHLISQCGAMDIDNADEYLDQLRDDRRYQRDVY